MPNGTIKRVVPGYGFGFLRDDGGLDWFFRRDGVQGGFNSLKQGQRVSFDEEWSVKGPVATRIRTEGIA